MLGPDVPHLQVAFARNEDFPSLGHLQQDRSQLARIIDDQLVVVSR